MLAISIANRAGEFARVAGLLDRFGAEHGLDSAIVADMQIALDEVLTNIGKYAHADNAAPQIDICLTVSENVLEAVIEDGGAPFDPLQVASPDLGAPLQQRRVGGVGIHFVRNLLDEVSYERAGDRNRLLLRKYLKK
jgi:serine/threonine-protein kinase RsbW/sigma-B regulation protein RsbU (phosphoserine phosphatase)